MKSWELSISMIWWRVKGLRVDLGSSCERGWYQFGGRRLVWSVRSDMIERYLRCNWSCWLLKNEQICSVKVSESHRRRFRQQHFRYACKFPENFHSDPWAENLEQSMPWEMMENTNHMIIKYSRLSPLELVYQTS
jgi:hypothetical protein